MSKRRIIMYISIAFFIGCMIWYYLKEALHVI